MIIEILGMTLKVKYLMYFLVLLILIPRFIFKELPFKYASMKRYKLFGLAITGSGIAIFCLLYAFGIESGYLFLSSVVLGILWANIPERIYKKHFEGKFIFRDNSH